LLQETILPVTLTGKAFSVSKGKKLKKAKLSLYQALRNLNVLVHPGADILYSRAIQPTAYPQM
jgi:hypothetical protein